MGGRNWGRVTYFDFCIPRISGMAEAGHIGVCSVRSAFDAAVGPYVAFPLSFVDRCLISWPATMCGPAIAMVRVVRPSVCHTQISPKLSEIDLWLLWNANRLPDSESAIRFAIRSTVPPFWAVTAEGWKWRILGASGVHGDACRPSGTEKPNVQESRMLSQIYIFSLSKEPTDSTLTTAK